MPSPWRDLNRIGERQQHRNDGPPRAPYGRRASHRNRRCARRHPARRRPAASLRDRRSCPASIVPRSTGGAVSRAGLAFRPTLRSMPVTGCVSFGPDRIMSVHADVRWETLDPPCSGPAGCRRQTHGPAPSRAFRFS
jgi:hypothetical protein